MGELQLQSDQPFETVPDTKKRHGNGFWGGFCEVRSLLEELSN